MTAQVVEGLFGAPPDHMMSRVLPFLFKTRILRILEGEGVEMGWKSKQNYRPVRSYWAMSTNEGFLIGHLRGFSGIQNSGGVY